LIAQGLNLIAREPWPTVLRPGVASCLFKLGADIIERSKVRVDKGHNRDPDEKLSTPLHGKQHIQRRSRFGEKPLQSTLNHKGDSDPELPISSDSRQVLPNPAHCSDASNPQGQLMLAEREASRAFSRVLQTAQKWPEITGSK
jgi:hypothetical protein